MGLYERYLLPSVINLACGSSPVMYQRRLVIPEASGRVLEIGVGSGLNLPFYDPAKVTHLWALEPSPAMRTKAAKPFAALDIPAEWLDLPGEKIPLADDSVDTVVLTFTLCTIPDPLAALAQMHRVLKPDGTLLFCEHGLAPDANVARWQQRINPIWRPIAGGCNLQRPIDQLLRQAGFTIAQLTTGYLPSTPKIAGFNYWGRAHK